MPSGPAAQPTGAATSSSGERGTRRPDAANRALRLEAKPHRVKNRVTVRLEFVLPTAKRVFLIVRGPAPSCRIAGVIPVRGHKGKNTVDFAGRIRRRPLKPGVYLLTISPTPRPAAKAPTEYVRVVSKRRSIPIADAAPKQVCSDQEALASARTAGTLRDGRRAAREETASPTAPLRPPLQGSTPAIEPDDEIDGLSGLIPTPGEIGSAARDSDMEALATFLVLALLGALLFGMLTLVTRFLRGNWNP